MSLTCIPRKARGSKEEGIGLIEILVSMFILTIIALALVPILVQGLKVSSSNATLATATGLLNGQLEDARSYTSCAGVTATNLSTTDSRGVPLKVVRTVGTCPVPLTAYPASISVSVAVTRVDTGAVVASARTSVYVEGP